MNRRKGFSNHCISVRKAWPHLETQLIPATCCGLISRYEAGILGRGSRRLKTIGFYHTTIVLGFIRPLSIEDVNILVNWSKSGGIEAYGGHLLLVRPTEVMLKHVQEWTEDTDGSVVVDGLSSKTRGQYHPAYNGIFDSFDLVIHCD